MILASVLLLLAGVFSLIKLPQIEQEQQTQQLTASIWQQKHLLLGALAIFVYVGAEVSIGSFLVNFLSEQGAHLDEVQAAHYVSYYWGGAMLGRFIGAALMMKIAAHKVLLTNAILAVLAVVVTINSQGQVAIWAILSVGLFNSVMFPTIFSLALRSLGALTSQASGLLCMAIVGGAIIPLIQGALADSIGIQLAFFLPAICYMYIAYFAIRSKT